MVIVLLFIMADVYLYLLLLLSSLSGICDSPNSLEHPMDDRSENTAQKAAERKKWKMREKLKDMKDRVRFHTHTPLHITHTDIRRKSYKRMENGRRQ